MEQAKDPGPPEPFASLFAKDKLVVRQFSVANQTWNGHTVSSD